MTELIFKSIRQERSIFYDIDLMVYTAFFSDR